MIPRPRMRSLMIGTAAAGLAFTTVTPATPASAQDLVLHSFRITISADNTRALSDRGVVVIPLGRATSRTNGSGTNRTVSLTFPTPDSGSSPFPVEGGVMFLNLRTWRYTTVTHQRFTTQVVTGGVMGSLSGAVSSKGGAREDWLVSANWVYPAAAMPQSFLDVLGGVAGAPVVRSPFGTIQQCMNGPCP